MKYKQKHEEINQNNTRDKTKNFPSKSRLNNPVMQACLVSKDASLLNQKSTLSEQKYFNDFTVKLLQSESRLSLHI